MGHLKKGTVVTIIDYADGIAYIEADASNVTMTEISLASYLSEDRLMTLTALNIADELLKSKAEVNAMRREMTQLRLALEKAQQLQFPLEEVKPE